MPRVLDARDVRHGITPFGWKGSFIFPASGRSTDILIPSLSRSIAVTTDGVDLPKAPLQFINREATADQVDGGRDAEGKKAEEQGRRSRNQARNGRWRGHAVSSSSERRSERTTDQRDQPRETLLCSLETLRQREYIKECQSARMQGKKAAAARVKLINYVLKSDLNSQCNQ